MSAATKKKHVAKEVLDELVLPEPHQKIVQVVAGKGNNLHQVFDPSAAAAATAEDSDGEAGKYLASMPTKFRKSVWIKRGDYVIVEPIEEGDKVKAEIVRILYKDQVKHIKKEGMWPKFPGDEDPSASGDKDDEDLFVNTNRPNLDMPPSDSSSSSSSSEEEDDE